MTLCSDGGGHRTCCQCTSLHSVDVAASTVWPAGAMAWTAGSAPGHAASYMSGAVSTSPVTSSIRVAVAEVPSICTRLPRPLQPSVCRWMKAAACETADTVAREGWGDSEAALLLML